MAWKNTGRFLEMETTIIIFEMAWILLCFKGTFVGKNKRKLWLIMYCLW